MSQPLPVELPDPAARSHAVELGLLAAACVAQNNILAQTLIRDLRDKGLKRRSVYEILLQSYLHDGYATALESTALLQRVWPAEGGEGALLEAADWEMWRERGEGFFAMIYGSIGDRVKEFIGGNSAELAQWMIAEGYGKVLGRGGLDPQTREVGNVSVLVMKNRPRQLYSHLRGSIMIGIEIEELDRLLALLKHHFPDRDGVGEAPFLLRTIEKKKDWD